MHHQKSEGGGRGGGVGKKYNQTRQMELKKKNLHDENAPKNIHTE